jgi:hypothetical protein
MPRSTHQAVADTWRAVRWAQTHGAASCETCYDGKDLKPLPPDARNPALRRYACWACDGHIVSDWSNTWIAPLKSPLARWAWLLLSRHRDDVPALAAELGVRQMVIRTMLKRFKTAPPGFLPSWQLQMHKAGITAEKLRKALQCSPRTT